MSVSCSIAAASAVLFSSSSPESQFSTAMDSSSPVMDMPLAALTVIDPSSKEEFAAPLSATEQEAAAYIAGYLGRKVVWPNNCDACLSAVVSNSPVGLFIQEKQYQFIKKGLCYPTQHFASVVRHMESLFQKTIASDCHKRNIMDVMKVNIRAASLRLFDVLSDHDLGHQMHLLDKLETMFVRVRLHHFAKQMNAQFRQDCSRKANKKWQKLGVNLPDLPK